MGKSAGKARGVEMCLEAMIDMKLVKLKHMPNGDDEIVKYDDA